MQDRLEKMNGQFSDRDMKKIDKSLKNIDKKAEISFDEKERILSSVMRKAGIEMQNGERAKDNIKVTGMHKLAPVAAIAASLAVGMLVGTVISGIGGSGFSVFSGSESSSQAETDEGSNVYSYRKIIDPEALDEDELMNTYRDVTPMNDIAIIEENYGFDFYDYFNEKQLLCNAMGENEDYTAVITSVVSDGEYAYMTAKLTAKSEKGKAQVADRLVYYEANWYYADSKAAILQEGDEMNINTQYPMGVYRVSEDTVAFGITAKLPKREDLPKIIVQLYPEWAGYSEFSESSQDTENPYGVCVTVDLNNDLESKEIFSENGARLSMTALGVAGTLEFEQFDEALCDTGYWNIELIDNNGEVNRVYPNRVNMGSSISQYEYLNMKGDESFRYPINYRLMLREPIDLDNCTGIVINGVEFKVKAE